MMLKLALSIIGVVALAGCSAHYRQSLADYRRNEPTPYLQRTEGWVDSVTSATAAAVAAEDAAAAHEPAMTRARATFREALKPESTAPETVFTEIVAEVFALAPAEAERRLAPLRDPDAAQARLAERFDWDTLRLAVALHNPAVRAGGLAWQAALRQFEQADYLESLMNQYRAFSRTLEVEPGNQMNRRMAQTFFPSPSAIALKGEMVRQMALMAREDWAMALRDQAIESGRAYYEYQYLTRALVVSRENVTLVSDLLTVVEGSYQAGSGSQTDLVKLQTTLARIENEQRDMESMRAAQAARIKALLGFQGDAALGPPEDRDYPLTELDAGPFIERALRQRQEIRIQQAAIERTRIAIRMGEAMDRPLATQGYSLFERGMMGEASPGPGAMAQGGGVNDDGGMAEGGGSAGEGSANGDAAAGGEAGFGLRAKAIARPGFAQSESYRAEMRQRLAAELARLDQLLAQTRGQARGMIEELATARREVALLRDEVLPNSDFTFQTARSAYTAGEASFLDMLDSERMLLDARMELQRARRDQNLAALSLAMIAGVVELPH